MNPADRLVQLHLRLVNDESTPFTVIGLHRVKPTPAGRRWLKDFADYNAIYLSLLRKNLKPDAILHQRVGLIVND